MTTALFLLFYTLSDRAFLKLAEEEYSGLPSDVSQLHMYHCITCSLLHVSRLGSSACVLACSSVWAWSLWWAGSGTSNSLQSSTKGQS